MVLWSTNVIGRYLNSDWQSLPKTENTFIHCISGDLLYMSLVNLWVTKEEAGRNRVTSPSCMCPTFLQWAAVCFLIWLIYFQWMNSHPGWPSVTTIGLGLKWPDLSSAGYKWTTQDYTGLQEKINRSPISWVQRQNYSEAKAVYCILYISIFHGRVKCLNEKQIKQRNKHWNTIHTFSLFYFVM